jgi:membrane protein DedA with SNARE-associated domain
MGGNSTFAWAIVLFLGGWLLFGALRDATEDSGIAITLLVQFGALAVVIGVVVLVVRRQR